MTARKRVQTQFEKDARKAAALMKRLEDCVFGRAVLSPSQVAAIRISLDKVRPTLKPVERAEDIAKPAPIEITRVIIDRGPPEDRARAMACGMPEAGYEYPYGSSEEDQANIRALAEEHFMLANE